MGEENEPAISDVVIEPESTMGGVDFKVWNGVPEGSALAFSSITNSSTRVNSKTQQIKMTLFS